MKSYRSLRRKKVELRETQRAVTPFGGVFLEFLRRVGYPQAVSQPSAVSVYFTQRH